MRFLKLNILIIALNIQFLVASDTLRIATYNLLNYSGASRTEYFKVVLPSIDADILIVQEVINQTAVDSIEQNIFNNSCKTIAFNDGPDTDNHFFYDCTKVQFLSASYIPTVLRDFAEYKFRVLSNDEIIYIYSAHLKASYGTTNEDLREVEAIILRNYLNNHPTGTNFIVVGDMNFYDSDEDAYQKFIGNETDNDGRLYDPINTPGDWHNDGAFSSVHTQSPRSEQFGGVASGGLDDRFDFILISESLQDNYILNSYTAFGNDGNHFNLSINVQPNSAVSPEIAEALYQSSDHLPVTCEFIFRDNEGPAPPSGVKIPDID